MKLGRVCIYVLLSASLLFSTLSYGLPAMAFEQLPRSLAWELISQSGEKKTNSAGYSYGVHYVQPGDTVDMFLTVKNRSRNPRAEVWYGKSALINEGPNYPNAHAIGVGTWDPMDHTPTFLDATSFVTNGNRFLYYEGPATNKGKTLTLRWQVKIAANVQNGTYNLPLALVREHDEWGYRVTASGANHKYRSVLYQFVVGDYVAPSGYHTATTPYGFTFDYHLGSQDQLNVNSTGRESEYQDYRYKWDAAVGVPDTGSVNVWVKVWDLAQGDMIVPIDKARLDTSTEISSSVTQSHMIQNGISWTVFKWHGQYADANHERRIGQLPDGTIIEIESMGWSNTNPDANFLNSIRQI